MRRFSNSLLASLAIAPSAALFIALLTGSLSHQRLALEWPKLIEGGAAANVLIAALPGMLIFMSLHRWLHNKIRRVSVFAGCTLLACCFSAFLLAQAFGTTWSNREILLELMAAQLPLLALALLPGTLLVSLLPAAGPQRPA